MKRKDFEDVDDDFLFPSSKSRRLVGDLFATINEDPRSAAQVFEESPQPGDTVMQTDALPGVAKLPSEDEKALVVYNPENARLIKAPDSLDFSIIVRSDLIPGLRDHIYLWGNSKSLKSVEDRGAEEENKEVSNGCLAVVPWVPSNFPPASRDEMQVAGQPEPMEAEDVEMMDTDDGVEGSGFGRVNDGSGGLQQHWQQQQLHWMEPQLHQNNYTHVT